eukprot:GCRY01001203.1.p1 GENE.GCRY01001203.1~~GCRY01001203.1.p1  ORF type:complete len:668 (+),score=119.86 GCRY01001203.1:271-2274(+)
MSINCFQIILCGACLFLLFESSFGSCSVSAPSLTNGAYHDSNLCEYTDTPFEEGAICEYDCSNEYYQSTDPAYSVISTCVDGEWTAVSAECVFQDCNLCDSTTDQDRCSSANFCTCPLSTQDLIYNDVTSTFTCRTNFCYVSGTSIIIGNPKKYECPTGYSLDGKVGSTNTTVYVACYYDDASSSNRLDQPIPDMNTLCQVNKADCADILTATHGTVNSGSGCTDKRTGDTCGIACDSNFDKAQAAYTFTCSDVGDWEYDGSIYTDFNSICVERTCSDVPDTPRTLMNPSECFEDVPITEAFCQFECPVNYSSMGDITTSNLPYTTSTCQASSTDTSAHFRSLPDCYPYKCFEDSYPASWINAENRTGSCGAFANVSDYCIYDCPTGYTLTGTKGDPAQVFVRCWHYHNLTVAEWEIIQSGLGGIDINTMSCQIAECIANPPSNIENATKTSGYCSSSAAIGSQCIYSCNANYSLDGHEGSGVTSFAYTCNTDGDWVTQNNNCQPDNGCVVSNPCLNGGKCVPQEGSLNITCSCPTLYDGDRCQFEIVPQNPSSSSSALPVEGDGGDDGSNVVVAVAAGAGVVLIGGACAVAIMISNKKKQQKFSFKNSGRSRRHSDPFMNVMTSDNPIHTETAAEATSIGGNDFDSLPDNPDDFVYEPKKLAKYQM